MPFWQYLASPETAMSLGDEQPSFTTGCPAQWAELPRPDLPLVVGLDDGYVHSCTQRTRRDGWFEVIAGKTMPADGASCCFGYVQTYDTKPNRRLFEVLAAQGMQPNQQVRTTATASSGGQRPRRLTSVAGCKSVGPCESSPVVCERIFVERVIGKDS
jgi:hypothetical protein